MREWTVKKMTNYERVKSMSIEEMALFLYKILECCRDEVESRSSCSKECPLNHPCMYHEQCIDDDIRTWLKSEVKQGHWIHSEDNRDPRDNFYYCSECGRIINIICGDKLSNYPYCHCGARMDGEENDD